MDTLEISDLDDKEIWAYLNFKLGAKTVDNYKEELVYAVNNITGGRMLYLTDIADSCNSKESIHKTCNNILKKANDDFTHTGMNTASHPNYQKFRALAKLLLEHGKVSNIEAAAMLTTSEYQDLRKSNVFAYHKGGVITFQSRAHETVTKRLLGKK